MKIIRLVFCRDDFNEATYSIEKTKSVFVTIENHTLIIRKPAQRVVPKLAFYDEKEPSFGEIKFTEQREYNLLNADVFLMPLDVPVKLRWLQRFPIGIKLKTTALKENILVVERSENAPRFLAKDESTLILFARCDREKEEFYWKFIRASGKSPFPIRLAPVTLSAEMKPLDIMLHRLFGDVLVEPAWNTTLRKKIETKLASMKRPKYLEELKVLELNMGPRLPSFGEVSKPRIDRFGIWMEMDFELRGPVTITLVTSLNPFKLTKKVG